MDWLSTVSFYCERTSFSPWAEPYNTLSSFFFFGAGLYAWMLCKRHRSALGYTTELLWIVFSVMLIGLVNIAHHVAATPISGIAHVLCLALFLHLYTVFLLRHVTKLPVGKFVSASVMLLSLALSYSILMDVSPMVSSPAYFVSVLAFGAFLFALYYHQESHRNLVLIAFILYLIALFFRLMDRPWCESLPHGTYFLWLLFNVPVLGLLMRFLVLNRASHF